MENQTAEEELIAHLSSTDRQFQALTQQHAHLKQRIQTIETKAHVTGTDEIEEQRLKKLKLQAKDQMTQILSLHKHAVVG